MTASKIKDILNNLKETWNDTFSVIVYTPHSETRSIIYKYYKMIGRGTFGVVVLVEDINSKYRYALKRVFQDARFHNRELEIFKQIQHENIVKLHYYYIEEQGPKGKYLNLFMEYLPNNLEILISQKKVFSIDKIKKWALQLVSAIEYLHSKGICHRDIKPANILLDSSLEKLVICDMGSAKVLKDGGSNVPYVCSRYYRSPENILGIETYDCKIDVWSVGCVLVELHTGEVLFKGSSNNEMFNLILSLCKCSKADLLEMGCDPKEYQSSGIREYLGEHAIDESLVNLYEKMLVFNPTKRASATKLKNMMIFNKFKS